MAAAGDSGGGASWRGVCQKAGSQANSRIEGGVEGRAPGVARVGAVWFGAWAVAGLAGGAIADAGEVLVSAIRLHGTAEAVHGGVVGGDDVGGDHGFDRNMAVDIRHCERTVCLAIVSRWDSRPRA